LDQMASEMAARYPHSRSVVRAVIHARLTAGLNVEDSAVLARLAAQQWPNDPQVWGLLARVESARGKKTAQHAALAEQYALAGATASAIEQLTLARGASDADFVTLSRIDSRLTTLRAALRREQMERQQAGGKN
jgi:predicted Zn-dependent protease